MLTNLVNKSYNKAAFRSRYAHPIHLCVFVFIFSAMVLSVARVFINRSKKRPTTRADTMAIAMGAKSLLFLAYQHFSAPGGRLSKWGSLKANAVLNGLEILFWSAVAGMTFQSLRRSGSCAGVSCVLGALVVVLAALIVVLEQWLFVISYLDFRYFKANGKRREQANEGGCEMGQR
ncbi:hypothetical protein N0V90_006377 [Kalmusia sp. IMI 367209]|nr:hypothetical protein N0V90_006377 [Kalmusia sp. IMI 367209]